MLTENSSGVNWLAAMAVGVAMHFVGGAWYGAVSQTLWHRLRAYSPDELARVRVKTRLRCSSA